MYLVCKREKKTDTQDHDIKSERDRGQKKTVMGNIGVKRKGELP